MVLIDNNKQQERVQAQESGLSDASTQVTAPETATAPDQQSQSDLVAQKKSEESKEEEAMR